jgi:hypothetical protein
MSTPQAYIQLLFKKKGIPTGGNKERLFEAFMNEEENIIIAKQIFDHQQRLMDTWKIKSRVADIWQQPVIIPNATVGKAYEARLDFSQLNWNDLESFEVEGLEEYGLAFDEKNKIIQGTPVKSGDIKVKLKYRIPGEAVDAVLNEKLLSLVINPDPKSLWKNIDSNTTAAFWKADNVAESAPLGDKHLVVASKRGRSHANVGSFRDDDYAFKHFEDTGWSVVAVSDGAGSAKLSREGSRIATTEIINYFEQKFTTEIRAAFDALMMEHEAGSGAETLKKLNLLLLFIRNWRKPQKRRMQISKIFMLPSSSH